MDFGIEKINNYSFRRLKTMKYYQITEYSNSSRMVNLDLDSKLLQEGIIEISEEFDPETVSTWRNALLYLKSKFTPEETQSKPIQLYINSPGGDVYSMLGLYDTIKLMQRMGYVISTVNVGLAASAACFILMAGNKGYRKSLVNCRAMMHTISTMSYGKVEEIIVTTEELKKLQETLDNIVKEQANQEIIEKYKYLDFWMTANDAKQYGIIDDII